MSPEVLVKLQDFEAQLDLSEEAWANVKKSRQVIDKVLAEGRTVYGINTGFGKFCRVLISPDKLQDLQFNLITSHACGVGQDLSPQRARTLMALRINVLAKGFSGISCETLQQMIDAFNAGVVSQVPEQGTVGASGDLAPLAHIALGLCGIGDVYSHELGITEAEKVLDHHNLKTLNLKPKEGLALINGTQFISSLGSEALIRAELAANTADVIAALSFEGLMGFSIAFDPRVHSAKKHRGQRKVAKTMRSLTRNKHQTSQIGELISFDRVMDPYTLRCIPQVHGVVHDTLDFCRSVLQVELNSATDNPMILAHRDCTISCGNFHGEYPAKTLDILAIGIHEMASISERRIERFCNPKSSGEGQDSLPAFLAPLGGLHSGFMMAHVTASALVSENKVLCHPSSTDTLSTSAGTEDHVSMGGWAARKALKVVENVENCLAIELLCACQAIDLRRPLTTTPILEKLHALVRSKISFMAKDRFLSKDMKIAAKMVRDGSIWNCVKEHVMAYED